MKVLIVDDDIYSIQGMEKGVSWNADGIDDVCYATNASTARTLLEREKIDIMICDIEMPNESGIELIRWIRDRKLPIVVIIYSSYADFVYAQSAVSLKVFHYILKPSPYQEIDDILKLAVKEKKKQDIHSSVNVEKGAVALYEKLFRAIVNGSIPNTDYDIERLTQSLNLPPQTNKHFLLILHDIKNWEDILCEWAKIDFEFCIKNMIRELFLPIVKNSPIIFSVYQKYYLTILSSSEPIDPQSLISKCLVLNQSLVRLTNYGINSAIGSNSLIYDLPVQCEFLLELLKRTPQVSDAVLFTSRLPEKKVYSFHQQLNSIYECLLKNASDRLQTTVQSLFLTIETNHNYSFYQLQSLSDAYIQTVKAVLQIKNMDFEVLENNTDFQTLYKHSFWGPSSIKRFITETNMIVLTIINKVANERDIILEIKSYIDQHLKDELNRSDLAHLVFINEDYLSRLFHKQEGISLTQYITNKKIERAKKLLQLPAITVTMASEAIGITNFPYFSKLFKKETGLSPSEYKKQCLLNSQQDF